MYCEFVCILLYTSMITVSTMVIELVAAGLNVSIEIIIIVVALIRIRLSSIFVVLIYRGTLKKTKSKVVSSIFILIKFNKSIKICNEGVMYGYWI